MSNKIVINSGFKTYDLVNENDELMGKISLNPSDTNIAHRYKKVVEDLEKLDFNTEVKKTDGADEIVERIETLDDLIYEKINYLINADVAETFFSIMGPFTLLESGLYFVEEVINKIGWIIEKESGVRVKKMTKRIQKHTGKYHGRK